MTTGSRIDAKSLNELLYAEDVLKLIGYPGSNPKRSGGELRDCCPIHQEERKKGEKGGDLAINETKKTYYCHSTKCNSSGDLIKLYQAAKNITFPQAIEELSHEFNILPSNTFMELGKMTNILEKQMNTTKSTEKETIKTPREIWNTASELGRHLYLEKKKIQVCPGIRIGENPWGYASILVPYYNIEGELLTIQYLQEDKKLWHKGISPTGCFFTLGDIPSSNKIYIAEGLATSYTVWKAKEEQYAVISVGSAGNLDTVANLLHQKFPSKEIVLALDNNPAAEKARDKIEFKYNWCMPSFEGMTWEGETNPADFNDLVSMCEQPLSVVKEQLKKEVQVLFEPFYSKLGKVLNDTSFADSIKNRSYDSFEKDHKRLYSSGGLITGFSELDDQVYFSKGDLVIVQAMSNHGKSTFMLQLAYQFLTEQDNQSKDPLCIFITYESTPLRIEEKLLNIMSNLNNEGTILQYHKKSAEKYLYPNKIDYRKTIMTFNQLLNDNRINVLKRTPIENLSSVVELYKQEFPNRTIVLFLDYVQIIDNNIKSDGWERIKEISYHLESLAIKEEIIVFAACQVNDKRQSREGKDIYNAATTVIDVINHSHASLELNEDGRRLFKDKVNGKSLCSLSVIKQKHGSSFVLSEYMLFNGFCFQKKTSKQNLNEIEKGDYSEFF